MKDKLRKFFKCIFNEDYRFNVLSNFSIYNSMNDEKYLKKKYKAVMHKELNLDNPKTFNEKLQWLKINDHNPEYTMMVDKYEVKKYIENIIGEEYIVPTIGIYNSFEEIDFAKLPYKFVMKCTHDSGGIVICKDKSTYNKKNAKQKINKYLKRNFYYSGREWPYKNVKPRIIIEKYMEDKNQPNILDYKFFCFNGKVEYLYVSAGSHSKEQCLQFFDRDYNSVDCRRNDYRSFDELPPCPKSFNKMIEYAELLSKGIEHVRVDFYEINGKLYFSEFTFYTGSGFIPFEKDEWDIKLGRLINIQNVMLKNKMRGDK